ncbi:GGDEF domain-containing protein, partial [Propionivibrio sp.]|uniref:GGDEF domain-containing protein n=1 Tax=Propionivibrio sp. TaxID=2212460 RepID=UPI003BF0F349
YHLNTSYDTFIYLRRLSDIPVRLGGDEFALLLPGMDSVAAQVYVSDLQRQLMAAMGDHHWPVTFSIGVASYAQAPPDLDRLLANSDSLMYEVKRGGRSRILQKNYTP